MTGTLELEAALVLGHWNAELGHVVTFADLLAATPFDADDRPPAGTECVQCRQLDHYCPAKGYCGEYPLCLACGGGIACEQLAAVERFRSPSFEDEELFAKDAGAPSEGRSVEITDADRIAPEERPLVTAWAAKASLDPENLKRGLKRSARAPLRLRRVDKEEAAHERALGRRIEKAKVLRTRVAVLRTRVAVLRTRVAVLRTRVAVLRTRVAVLRTRVAPPRAAKTMIEESVMSDQPKVVRTFAARVCICGCDESFVPTGVAHKYKEGHKPKAVKKALGGGQAKEVKGREACRPGYGLDSGRWSAGDGNRARAGERVGSIDPDAACEDEGFRHREAAGGARLICIL